ncbi:MAG: MarR family transcriptional regulator [Alphaproteobacteria bacterium]|nr:MarR family transcriptional regulator [Alphaproteobacteria bacterium]
MELTPIMQRYILHWGEMGARWGTSRSVAQIHALLYLAPQPLHAEEIAETLEIARSNVSVSLKELQNWELVQVTHVLGDRRDHFTALKDNWSLLMVLVEGRKKREIDPTLVLLRELSAEAARDTRTPAEIKARITALLSFMETLTNWFEQVKRIPKPTLVALMKLGSKVTRFIG